MRAARHRTAWPVAVLVVLALGVTGCRKAGGEPGASAAGASTASQSPTDLDGCITVAEATLMQFAGGASGEISAAIFGTGQVGVVVSNTIVGRACDLLP